MRKVLLWALFLVCALGMIAPGVALGQASVESKRLPSSFLKGLKPKTDHAAGVALGFGSKKNGGKKKSSATTGLPGVDSIANWSDQFIAEGFDENGNSETVWPYTMVGTPPESGQTTWIEAPIIPMELDLLGSDGKVASYNGHPLKFIATRDIVDAVMESPIFEPFKYNSGFGQFNDQMLRTEFWNRINRHDDDDWDNGWHNFLVPSVKRMRTMQIPFGFWFFFTDANGNPAGALVDDGTFGSLLFPPTYPVDNSTPIGAAELAGDMTTRTLASLLFNNVFLYDGDPNNCCVLGFHSYDLEPGIPSNGNRERRYIMDFASWVTNGIFLFGFEDITPMSHEVAETFNDPFGDNVTPWWLSVDPATGQGQCQDVLEVGDVVEVLTGNPVYATALNGRTYHPQNEALLQWFEFQSPSKALHRAYSFPDETTLTALSPSNLLPGCKTAP